VLWLQQGHLVAKQVKLGKKWPLNFVYQYFCHTSRDLEHAVKTYDMRLMALLSPLKEVRLQIFVAFKNPSRSAGFEPANQEQLVNAFKLIAVLQ
jgi:hypothetical protein